MPMPVQSKWKKLDATGRPLRVDRQGSVIQGMILAQEGPFKSEGRGEFDEESLTSIVQLMSHHKTGLKSRFCHPTLSDDGLGKFLGRISNGRQDTCTVRRDGVLATLKCVRGDLKFDATAYDTPSGNLADYVMRLAESDPDALSSSLVIEPEEVWRTDASGRPLLDANGNQLPPLWKPIRLHACDIVDTGDAVDGLLSANLSVEGLPDNVVRQACQLLDAQFESASREVVQTRVQNWLLRYLDWKFGSESKPVETVPGSLAAAKKRLRQLTQ